MVIVQAAGVRSAGSGENGHHIVFVTNNGGENNGGENSVYFGGRRERRNKWRRENSVYVVWRNRAEREQIERDRERDAAVYICLVT